MNARVRLALLCFSAVLWSAISRAVEDPKGMHPEDFIAPLPMGVLGRPFGESVVVQGKVIEGPFKMEDSTTEGRLLVQRVNGVATQQGIVLRFDPITSREWWDASDHLGEGKKLWQRKEKKLAAMLGKTFEMRGYEHGVHVGRSAEQYWIDGENIQSSGFHFHPSFRTLLIKEIPAVRFTPEDFVERTAELEGRAKTRDGAGWMLDAAGWALQVRDTPWPADLEEHEISARGRVTKTATGTWRMEDADARLQQPADQLGREVKLDGIAMASLGNWWLEYRGENIYIEFQSGRPGWTDENRWRPVTVSGVLERSKLPDLAEIGHVTHPKLREYYIIRRASWAPLDLAWQKPPEPPKAPPLTVEYLKGFGIKLEGRHLQRFNEWSQTPGH